MWLMHSQISIKNNLAPIKGAWIKQKPELYANNGILKSIKSNLYMI